MGLAELLYKDPSDRFKEIAGIGATSTTQNDAVSPAAIEEVIQHQRQANGTAGDISTAISRHVALNTLLTEPVAQQVVASAMASGSNGTGAASDSASAKAVSAAVSQMGVSGNVSLSDPAMLGPIPRLAAAALLGVIGILSVGYEANLAPTTGWGAYVALTIGSVLSILGVLILVMGYKTVTISGSSTPPG